MRSKMTVITTISLVVFAVALASEGLAKNGGTTVVWDEVQADLVPFCTPVFPETTCTAADLEARGEAERRIKIHKTFQERNELKIKVEVMLPSTGLGIADAAAAEAADIRVILSRSGAPYAECFLELNEIEAELEDGMLETKAQWRLDVRLRSNKKGGPGLRLLKGMCDIGLPDVQDGDVATAVLVIDNPDPATPDMVTPFLQGMFED